MQRKIRFAKTLSTVGHPLILGNIYVIGMSFHKMETTPAIWVSGLTLILITVPIIWHNLRKMKNGKYSNFDVSDHDQRKSFYPFAIALFVLLSILFYFLPIPESVTYQTVNFLLMLVLMAGINISLKASLHAGIAFYIALSLTQIHVILGLILFLLAIAISWSRKVSGRHSMAELIVGGAVGVIFGTISLFIL